MVVKSVEIDLSVKGDAESKAKLDAIDARAEALKKAFPTYALKVDSAAATQKLAVFRADFKTVADAAAKPIEVQVVSAKAAKTLEDIRLRAEKLKATFPQFTAKIDDGEYKAKLAVMAAEAKATGDLISRELSGGAGGVGGGAGGASGGLGSIGPLPLPALLAIVPAAGAALVEVTGLVSGFAAATAGAAAFALLAVPAVKKVETAYTNLNTAQMAYQNAQAKYNEDPTKSNATALKNATLNLDLARDAISKLPASEQGAIKGIQGLVTEFGKLSTAFQPEAFKVFNAALKLAGTLLPDIVPFAKTFADVVTTLLTQAGKFSQTKGFTDFLQQFHGIEGPAITAIGDGIGKVVVAFGKLITTMSGKDVANTINIAFGVIAGAINIVADVVHNLMKNWDGMSSAAKRVTHDVAGTFDDLRHNVAADVHQVSDAIDTLRTVTATVFHDMAGAVLQFGIIMANGAKTITGVFLDLVGNIINGAAKAFGWIPGLGAKLRGAAADFSTWRTGVNSDFDKVISKMQAWQNGLNTAKGTAATATQSIGSDVSGMGVQVNTAAGKVSALNYALTHLPKSTNVNLTETGVGNFTITQGTSGHAGGTPTGGRPGAAAGLYVAAGTTPTADDVLIRASKGELVVPTHLVASGLVDHLRGLIPGFAGGGSIGSLGPATTAYNTNFDATMTAAMEKAMTAAMKAAVTTATAAAAKAAGAAGGSGGPVSADAAAAQAYAKSRLGAYGWGADQMTPLISLWNEESGWNRLARNPSSGAYGIPQAYPGSKMGAAANPPSSSAGAQIDWGLGYIKSSYGSPGAAYAFENSHSPAWYAKGGLIPGYAKGGTVASQGAAYLKGWRKSAGTVNAQIDHWTHEQHIDSILAGAAGLSQALHAKYAKASAGDKKTVAGLTSERTVLRDWRTQLSGSDVSLNAWISAAGKIPQLRENVAHWKKQLASQKATIGDISAMLGLTGAQLAADAAAAKAASAAAVAAAAAASAASAAGSAGGAGTTAAGAAAAVPLTPAAALALLTGGTGAGGVTAIPALAGAGTGTGAFPWPGWGGSPGSPGSPGWGADQGRPGMAAPGGTGGGGMSGLLAELQALRAEVRQLTGVAAAIPRATGQHVGGAINGAAAAGSFRARYP